MQDPQLELSAVIRLMEETQVFLKHYRETGFEETKITETELAENVDAEAVFQAAVQIRVRHKKRLFDYESRDDPIQDPETCYRIENFNVIVDTAINLIAVRFLQMQKHNGNFSFLYDIK